VKNHTFKEFWDSIEEIENQMRNNSNLLSTQDL